MNTQPSQAQTSELYAFTLGREWKLSLAELFAIFSPGSYVEHSEEVAIFSISDDEKSIITNFRNIGGSIRMMRVIRETEPKKFPLDVLEAIGTPEGKYHLALGVYGTEFMVSDIGLRIKKTLGERGISSRLVNTENKNINAATWKKEKLGRSQSEFNLICLNGKCYITQTLACQDIDAYARRDLKKSRDMTVGMMPPKLVQMLLNIASRGSPQSKKIYDPFCGLGTTLIEAANMGFSPLYGSDISTKMVAATTESMESYIKEEQLWQDRIRKAGGTPNRDIEKMKWKVWEGDASAIGETKISLDYALIVSEGYLGDIMNPRDISLPRVQDERKKLAKIYTGFFQGLKERKFNGTIVMSFPFWSIHGTYSYFTEIYDILEQLGFHIAPLLPSSMKLNTMKGSLLYKRESQTVGREIIKIHL